MKQSSLVSILIPAFNAERYIKEALDSALAQTYRNIEIVVVDDGSKDKTAQIVKSYSDERLRYVHQENQGVVKVRNRLLREARGELLTYLDADDIYLPEKVEEEAGFLNTHSDHAAVYCNINYFFDGAPDKFYKHRYTFYSGDIFEPLLRHMFITNTALMFRRSVVDTIGFYDETLGTVEDWQYLLRMARRHMKFGFIKKPLVRFRLRWDNNTRFENQAAIQESGVKIFENLKSQLSAEERSKYGIEAIVRKRKVMLAIAYLASGSKTKARATFREADSSTSWNIFSFLFFILSLAPAALLRLAVEKGWNIKKRNLFVPVS